MSNPTYKELERERIEKIKNLSSDELEAYIDNLNKKIYDSWFYDNDNVSLYSDKLLEVINLTELEHRGVRRYAINGQLDLSHTKLVEGNLREIIFEVVSNTKILSLIIMKLVKDYTMLDYVLMIYYHNYLKVPKYMIEGLSIHLEFEHNFKNEDFDKYLDSYFQEYNEILMRELDFVIAKLRENLLTSITMIDLLILDDIEHSNETLNELIGSFKKEKNRVIKNSKDNKRDKLLKDGNYFDLNLKLIEVYKNFDNACKHYLEIKEKVLDLVNSEDGFVSLKNDDYDITYEDSNSDNIISREDFIAMRPCYNMKEGKFLRPT